MASPEQPPLPLLFLIGDTGGGHRSAAAAVQQALDRVEPGRFAPVTWDPLRGPDVPGLLRWFAGLYGLCIRLTPVAVVVVLADQQLAGRAARAPPHDHGPGLRQRRAGGRGLPARPDRGVPPDDGRSGRPARGGRRHRGRRSSPSSPTWSPRTCPGSTRPSTGWWCRLRWSRTSAPRTARRPAGTCRSGCRSRPSSAARRSTRSSGASSSANSGFAASSWSCSPAGPRGPGGCAAAPPRSCARWRTWTSSSSAAATARCGGGSAALAERTGDGRLTAQGFVGNMADWLRCADIVVGKAGPGTIAEATCCGAPLVLTSFVPGQEKGNAEFVTDVRGRPLRAAAAAARGRGRPAPPRPGRARRHARRVGPGRPPRRGHRHRPLHRRAGRPRSHRSPRPRRPRPSWPA